MTTPRTPGRPIPPELSIQLYFHCRKCLEEKPEGMSPQEWSSLEIGYTALGIQVWCKRHNINVVHVDFEGVQHPGNFNSE
jgi:hypothetical protein